MRATRRPRFSVAKGEDMKSGFIGMVLVVCLITPAIFLGGGEGFLNIPSVLICIGLPIGLCITSAGVSDVVRALRALRCLVVAPRESDLTARNAQVLGHMITYAYAAGVIGTMIGWIQILQSDTAPDRLPIGVAVSLLTLFYSILISECVLRPAVRRIEGELKRVGG